MQQPGMFNIPIGLSQIKAKIQNKGLYCQDYISLEINYKIRVLSIKHLFTQVKIVLKKYAFAR